MKKTLLTVGFLLAFTMLGVGAWQWWEQRLEARLKAVSQLAVRASMDAFKERIDRLSDSLSKPAIETDDQRVLSSLARLRGSLEIGPGLDLSHASNCLSWYISDMQLASHDISSRLPDLGAYVELLTRIKVLSPSGAFRRAEIAEIESRAQRLSAEIDAALPLLK